MTCIKAQSMITQFINNQLSLKETEDFIDHIGSCSDCREELEVYYALLTAMRQLDEDKNLSSDFGLELDQKLERARERILHAKFTYYRKKVILILTILLLAILFNFSYASKSLEEENTVIESNFRIRHSFSNGRNDQYEALLQEYLKEHENTPVPTEPVLFP